MESEIELFFIKSKENFVLGLPFEKFKTTDFGANWLINRETLKSSSNQLDVDFSFLSLISIFFEEQEPQIISDVQDLIQCNLFFNPSKPSGIHFTIDDVFEFSDNEFSWVDPCSSKTFPNFTTFTIKFTLDGKMRTFHSTLEELFTFVQSIVSQNQVDILYFCLCCEKTEFIVWDKFDLESWFDRIINNAKNVFDNYCLPIVTCLALANLDTSFDSNRITELAKNLILHSQDNCDNFIKKLPLRASLLYEKLVEIEPRFLRFALHVHDDFLPKLTNKTFQIISELPLVNDNYAFFSLLLQHSDKNRFTSESLKQLIDKLVDFCQFNEELKTNWFQKNKINQSIRIVWLAGIAKRFAWNVLHNNEKSNGQLRSWLFYLSV